MSFWSEEGMPRVGDALIFAGLEGVVMPLVRLAVPDLVPPVLLLVDLHEARLVPEIWEELVPLGLVERGLPEALLSETERLAPEAVRLLEVGRALLDVADREALRVGEEPAEALRALPEAERLVLARTERLEELLELAREGEEPAEAFTLRELPFAVERMGAELEERLEPELTERLESLP